MASDKTQSSKTILFVHGAYCDHRIWRPQVEKLSYNHEVLALNLPGSHPDCDLSDFSSDKHISFVTKAIIDLDRPVHLVGHSRGGRIAIQVAASLANAISSLTLIEPGGTMSENFLSDSARSPTNNFWASEAREKALKLLDLGETREAARSYLEASQGLGAWELAPELFCEIAPDNMHTLRAITADESGPLSRSVARKIQARCLLVQGQNSPAIFHRILDVLEEEIEATQRVEIAGAAHFPSVSHTLEFNRVLQRFIRGDLT